MIAVRAVCRACGEKGPVPSGLDWMRAHDCPVPFWARQHDIPDDPDDNSDPWEPTDAT